MRLLVHDFSGHPFQAQLSANLAKRGHDVMHVHCPQYPTGKGHLEDGPSLQVAEVRMRTTFARYSPLQRVIQETSYGARFVKLASGYRPDVLISCNDPLLAKSLSGAWCSTRSVPWVYWLQDLYSIAMSREAERRAGTAGRALGRTFTRLERWLLERSDSIVAITDDFVPVLERWGVDRSKCTVIENWAPIEEIPEHDHENSWKRHVGLEGRFVYLYSGTLGLKHDPRLLYVLAERAAEDDADVVVISQGLGAARLAELAAARPLPNLHLLPFQPYDRLPEVLGAADVLVALLEAGAGVFSVPSKVLTYMCAGRPILGSLPEQNLAARLIERSGAGIVAPAGSNACFLEQAEKLRRDAVLREKLGRAARAHAEANFDIEVVTDRFLGAIDTALQRTN